MEIIKTVSYSQEDIIKNIIELHSPEGIELDPTYSKGVFYKNIDKPKHRFDLNPVEENIIKSDCRNLPIKDNSISSIMFDPPFIVDGVDRTNGKKWTSKIGKRFSGFRRISDMWELYSDSLKEFYRILRPKGVLIFKCQDTVSSGKNYMSHCYVHNKAFEQGFYPKDLFILASKQRLIDKRIKKQIHARKYHSYFWVFEKDSKSIKYI